MKLKVQLFSVPLVPRLLLLVKGLLISILHSHSCLCVYLLSLCQIPVSVLVSVLLISCLILIVSRRVLSL